MNTPASVPDGTTVPLNDARYPSTNIRLSAILCPIGFPIKLEEPCSRTIDVNGRFPKEVVTFWHAPLLPNGEETHPTCPKLSATDIDAWWRYPGKFAVPGYDDALLAMRRVLEEREWILGLLHGSRRLDRPTKRIGGRGEVATTSVHFASIMKACDIPVVGFELGRAGAKSRFIFPPTAIPIAELLADASGEDKFQNQKTRKEENSGGAAPLSGFLDSKSNSPNKQRATVETFGRDLCVDWMTWALKYGDWLLKIVDDPGCIPTIEMRDHDRVLRISSTMPEKLKREWVSYL